MEPLISMIVPVYNVAAYLPRCLDSIVGQTYGNLEILLVDDGSTDGSGEICHRYARADQRIRVIHQENRGVSAARNAGLEEMTGEYVMFVDSDDWIGPDAVQVLYDRLERDGSQLAIGRKVDVFEDQTWDGFYSEWMTDRVYEREELIRFVADTCKLHVSAAGRLYRRQVLEGIRFPQACVGEDLAVFPEVLENCERISISRKVVYYYFQRPGSVMHQLDDPGRLEQLKYNLAMLRYLGDRVSLIRAFLWFSICIDIVYHLRDRSRGMAMMEEALTADEIKMLGRRQGIRSAVKWAAIRHPVVDKAVKLFYRHKTAQ